MVEVFRTNIEDEIVANAVARELGSLFPGALINFDLDDCDRILRVAGAGIVPRTITEFLARKGHQCEILE